MTLPSSAPIGLLETQVEVFGSGTTGKSLAECYLEANPSDGFPEDFPVSLLDFLSHQQFGDGYAESTYSSTVYLYNQSEVIYIPITNGLSETRIDRTQSNPTLWILSKTSGSYTAFTAGDALKVEQFDRVRGTVSWGTANTSDDPYTSRSWNSVTVGYDYKWILSPAT